MMKHKIILTLSKQYAMKITILMFAALSGMAVVPASALASPLDDQITRFSKAASSQSEAAMVKLLQTGLAEHRSAEAFAKAQTWLSRNHLKTQSALFYVGQAAQYSGEFQRAIGYYQRLLQMPNVDRKWADVATVATYRILINDLQDDNSAYLFMRKEGDRLRDFGRAKQYDRWFLSAAKARRDLVALCDRLATIANDRDANIALHAEDFEWLCNQFEQFKKEDADAYAAATRLASVTKTPAIIKARLLWAATVMPYNQKLDELREAKTPAAPKFTDAPLAAAAALLKVSPDQGAILIAKGWGVEYDHGHSGNCQKRFDVEGARKLGQLLAAVPSMSAGKRIDLLALPIAQGRVKFAPAEVRKLVIQFPGMLNSLAAADVPLFDKTLTIEEAKKLAPQLARNPHLHAALVRAFANPDRKYSTVVDQMMKTEAWRFKDVKEISHHIWNSGMFERDIEQDVPNKKYANLDSRYQQLKKQIDKKADSKQRVAAFNVLYKDLNSNAPTTPAALTLWDDLFAQAPDSDLSQMIKILVADTSRERGLLLKRALSKARFGEKKNGSMLWEGQVYNNQFRYHRGPVQQAVPELIAHLQDMIAKQAQAGTLDPTIFGMWLHTVDPKQKDAVAMIQKLITSPTYLKLDPSYHTSVADGNHFGKAMATLAITQAQPSYFSRELLALTKDSSPAKVEAALKTVVDRASKAPSQVAVIGLNQVAALPKWSPSTRNLVLSLFKENAPIGAPPIRQGYEALAIRIAKEAQESNQWGPLEPYAAGLWQVASAKDDPRSPGAAALSFMTEAALKANASSIAATFCRTALNGPAGRKLFLQKDWNVPDIANRVRGLSGKASIALGIIDIPVDEKDPTYPIYKSQSEFAQGNFNSAWDMYEGSVDQLQPIVRKLTMEYCLWLLDRNIEDRKPERAEALVKELTIWSRQASGIFTPTQEADLKIAYADIAIQKGALQTARAWYRRVADADEHKGTELQYKAVLRSVRVDRIARNFSTALADLDKLMLIRDAGLRIRVHFTRAEVFFDQEKYADAYTEVAAVLKSNPNHADALILMGKSQLEMRKLVDASEIELGISRDQKLIVPGEAIKINLNDPTLNVSGIGADIEVEIWTESGDRERVMLHQLGDDKTKFRAEIPTKLAPSQPGDKVLQVLGRDKIRYGYSKRFRAKMTDLPADPDVVIQVASDARLDVAAGAFPPREGERRLNLEELGVSSAQMALGTRNVRPGNPVYIRVHDPDQSKTDKVDQIIAAVQTTSGDVIAQLVLKETGTHTGEFEAIVPTNAAQALAYASESAPGRDANMVISGKPYPGWMGAVGSKASERIFGVDLNDNVALNQMVISTGDAGQTLTRFVVQTSMNGNVWTNRARYPNDPAPQNGRPTFESFHTRVGGVSLSAPKGRELPADWRDTMATTSVREACRYHAVHVPNLSAKNIIVDKAGHPNSSMLVRFRAYFYQPEAAIRTFQLTGLPSTERAQTVFLLDGQPVDEDIDDPFTIVRELRPGLHEIEVWRTEQRGELQKRTPKLLCDVNGQGKLVACLDSMFDPTTFPEAIRKQVAKPATIEVADAKKTQFNINFGEHTQARLVRLAIIGHAGVAPAIHKITLTDRDNVKRLPVKTDYQQLRENLALEVVPGDQITVRYEDDKSATPRRNRNTGRLGVAYNTGTISASFLTYETTDEGRELVLEDIRRFKLDDSVAIVITDPDMDQSPKADVITFSVAASGGASAPFKALETGPHTGVFIGRVFPVASAATKISQVLVSPGGTLTATYRDMENLEPGIPTDRIVTIEHARYSTPALALFAVTSKALPPTSESKDDNAKDANEKAKKVVADKDDTGPEIVIPRRALHYRYINQSNLKAQSPQALIDANLRFDVIATHLAFAKSSTVTAYVQTDAGRKAHIAEIAAGKAKASNQPFDVNVPGTLKLAAHPERTAAGTNARRGRNGTSGGNGVPAGYVMGTPAAAPTNQPPLDEGRFAFSVPLILEDLPARSYATQDADSLPSSQLPDGLAVRQGDTVHIGYAFKDDKGNLHWHTATATLRSHAFLDVMNSRYRRTITSAYVGEKLYLRLIAPGLDQSGERDITTVNLKTSSGAASTFQLRETAAHTGEFKGSFALSYATTPATGANTAKLPSVELHGFPVKYGDELEVAYRDTRSSSPEAGNLLRVAVNKGANGGIEPFSKRYGEDAVAITTTFTLAECFFELAKHHRVMGQESLARREMGHAQKLLAEAVASHQDDELRAQAEYLLGNLAQEFADLSKNEASKKLMYQDALARFSRIPLDYPDAVFAPKAQFKKALIYEKLGELDIAVEEYVKLAYKYPDHELIPSVMSRLGSYFQKEGLAFKTKADTLDKNKDDPTAASEALRQRDLATKEYLNAAQVFAKLQKRFPDDKLAGLAGLRSAQNYMRAGDFAEAVKGFQKVIDTEQYDGKTIRSQAMYWSGLSQERLEEKSVAYKLYRRITFDFPDSVWAKYARGRLADPAFARIIAIEEEQRQKMLDSLKNQ